jgi:carboxypeptidase Q
LKETLLTHDLVAAADLILRKGLTELGAMRFLERIVSDGPRLAGTPGAEGALAIAWELMLELKLDHIHMEGVQVPLWTRGRTEKAAAHPREGGAVPLAVCALGGSVATPDGGLRAGVLEVKSLDEAAALGSRASGRMVFFNRPMDPGLQDSFRSYGGAADQRVSGAAGAAEVGAVAVLVRSLTLSDDDLPHTGIVRYTEGNPGIPAAALGVRSADLLSAMLGLDPALEVSLDMTCRPEGMVLSHNLMGEIVGSTHPEEVIVMAGHLDTWDLCHGAHDDGAGCAQSLEAVRLILSSGMVPARTVRVVLYMSEEFGAQGGAAYAMDPGRAAERHLAALESDRGGFMPRGFTATADEPALDRMRHWLPLLEPTGIGWIREGFGGADIQFLARSGTTVIGLVPESQRYFDCHHCARDLIGEVHPRELEMGAAAMGILALAFSMEEI